jgi:hypothetical protein
VDLRVEPAPDLLDDRAAVERVPERLPPDRPPEALFVVRFAVALARLVVPLAFFVADLVVLFAVLRARLVAPLAFLRADDAVLFAVLLAPLARVPADLASACPRVVAAFAAALTVLPAAFTARLAAGAALRRDLAPPVADFTAVRAERTAALPLFPAALRCLVAAAFFAAADRCALV